MLCFRTTTWHKNLPTALSTRKQLSALIKQQMITEKLKQDNEKLTKESLKLKILYYKARLAQFK